jgi:hypothetical protein
VLATWDIRSKTRKETAMRKTFLTLAWDIDDEEYEVAMYMLDTIRAKLRVSLLLGRKWT